jgi:hypothetical protein
MIRSKAIAAAISIVLAVPACKTGSSNAVLGAATISALAIGAAVVERAAGGCIAVCTGGTVCNSATGFCERLPCEGQCKAGERCEQTATGSQCAPGGEPGVAAVAKRTETKIGIPVPTAPPGPGSPTIVPKAEEQPPPPK